MLGKLFGRGGPGENARRARARVMEIAGWGVTTTTGMGPSAEKEVSLKTKLLVRPADEAEFEVEKRFRFPKGAVPGVGEEVTVLYDPDDHESVELVPPEAPSESEIASLAGTGLGSGGASARSAVTEGDPGAQMIELAGRLQRGEITPEQFETEQKRILGLG
jgi:hypothetical protein